MRKNVYTDTNLKILGGNMRKIENEAQFENHPKMEVLNVNFVWFCILSVLLKPASSSN